MNDTQRENLAVLGRAQRSHLENQLRILESAQYLAGQPLVQVELQQQGLANLEGAEDWQIGLSFLQHLIDTEAEQLSQLPGFVGFQ